MFSLLAAALAAPTCPGESCTWAPDGRYLPITEPVVASFSSPSKYAIPPDADVVAVLLLPTTATVKGAVGALRFSALPASTHKVTGLHVPAPGGLPSAYGVIPVPVGTATVSGAVRPLYASLVPLAVPAGARELVVVPDQGVELTVLGFGAWTRETVPFPFVPDQPVADATWAPFPILPDETLVLPRPAALGPLEPIAGRVRREGDHLVDDRGPIQLYGTNLYVNWDLPTHADSERMSSAFAALGFNLVRMTVFPISRSTLYEGGRIRVPTEDEWDRLDALLDAFARRGIRVQLSLVPPAFGFGDNSLTARVDRVGNTDIFPFVDDAARERQKQWMRDFLGHPNRRRGGPLAEDPVLLAVEISNESGILRAWTSGVYEVLPKVWRDKVQARWNEWLRKKYGSDTAIDTAWAGSANPGLLHGEALGSVAVEPQVPFRWSLWPEARRRDLAVFHAELDVGYFGEMRRFLREDLGVEALIEGTQLMGLTASDAIQVAANDFTDTHYQYDHPGGWPQEQERQPLTRFRVDAGLRRAIQQAAPGLPYFMGEYNYGWPSPHEYEGPLLMATLGARQGWSAMNWFTWRHQPWEPDGAPKIEGQMDLAANPVKLGQLAAAAAILRGGLVPPAEGLCFTTLDGAADSPKFPIAEPLAGNGEGQPLVDCRQRTVFHGSPVPTARPMTRGPVTWDDQSTFVVDAPGASVILTDGDVRSTTFVRAGGAPGAISVVGLDQVALASAKRWLLSVGTRAVNTGHREAGGFTITESGEGPVLLAPWRGELVVKGPKAPKVTRLGPDGRPTGTIPVKKRRDGYVLALASAPPSTWYVVEW